MLALGVLCVAASSAAGMRSEELGRHLCKTVNGGKFVAIPGFPGEKIDRRLIPDIRWMKRKYDIFITDGYSRDPVHAEAGEHPIGLATDIVPNASRGGTWNEIGELAHFAEPQQNEPIMPWRWVGWNGDAGHGRGNHLHLSWSHSPSPPGHPARVVYTRICPSPGATESPPAAATTAARGPGPAARAAVATAARTAAPAREAVVVAAETLPAARSPRRSASSHRLSPRTLEAAKKMDRAARRREQSPGACVTVGSGQACPRHMPATA